jgi:transcriptional regulator with XRE-family HTH domain
MAASCKSPRVVPFQSRRAITTLAEMAKAQAARIGKRIRERRDELDLTQRELADLMTAAPGVGSQEVSNWERGLHRPNDTNLELLAEALQTTEADLVAGPHSERQPAGDTPDVIGSLNGNSAPGDTDELRAQLDRIEENQQNLIAIIEAQAESTSRLLDSKLEGLLLELDRRRRRAS